MRELLDFFKDIFIIKEETTFNIGLSQLKVRKKEIIKPTKQPKKKNEITLSELMRGQAS